MSLIPIATFLAGSLLSLLLPIALLIALAVWYVRSANRVPDGASEQPQASAPPTAEQPPPANPGSTVPGSS
jgi:hypothetical protein